jgi:hypothetical protein
MQVCSGTRNKYLYTLNLSYQWRSSRHSHLCPKEKEKRLYLPRDRRFDERFDDIRKILINMDIR